VVSVESGLGLDRASWASAKELETAHPEISEEFSLNDLELKAGKAPYEALRKLAERSNVEDLKKLGGGIDPGRPLRTSVAAR